MKRMIILFFICAAIHLNAAIAPTQLTCEYLSDPSVVDVLKPRLAWINVAENNERGQSQTAWQIRVATSKEDLDEADLWNSGKVSGSEAIRIRYDGNTLTSRQECWWQVRVWDKNDDVSEWSEPGFWRMGFLKEDDWQAQWIGVPWQGEEALPKPPGGPNAYPEVLPPPAPLLRKTFQIHKPVEKAVAYVTGLGYFQLYLNGKRVSDDELVPNQTNYGKRPEVSKAGIHLPDNFHTYKVMYLAYDIKDMLQKGGNAIGAILGNGFYNAPKFWTASYGSPRFIGQIHITYKDGSEDIITSDTSWKTSKSAIMMDLVYHGEFYDARKEQPGWSKPAFDDSAWQPAALRKAPFGKLVAHTAHPDKVTERLAPVKVEKRADGVFYVDFGVEISGRLRLNNVRGPKGHKVEIKYLSNIYSGDNTYTFRGDGPENYASRFNWFVFSAVEIHNWPGALLDENLTAEMVNTTIEESAVFETSNPLFNDINKIWRRSQIDNMHGGIASDCPHRERSAYTGDGQVACATVMHNYDAQNFYHKWIADMRDASNPETGYVPNGAPWQPGCGGGVAWGAAINIMPWEFYLHYGALDMLEDNFEAMEGYIRYMQTWVDEEGIMFSRRTGRDGKVLKWFNLGEWVPPGDYVPDHMVHTFYFWYCAHLTSQTASILGKTAKAGKYAEIAERTREAFLKKYFDPQKGSYGPGGGNIFALKMGVAENKYEGVISALKADIEANDGHLDTGICGTRFFFEVLSDHGLHDLAYAALNKRTEPSFGRWLELGSTTTREHWDESGSFNHPMFGGGLVWFYRKLAGMQADPEQPGYKHIIFKPMPVGGMDHVTYMNNTCRGKAGIAWKKESAKFTMDVSIPVGSTATVYVPADSVDAVSESGGKANQAKGLTFVQMKEGYAVFNAESGVYSFAVN